MGMSMISTRMANKFARADAASPRHSALMFCAVERPHGHRLHRNFDYRILDGAFGIRRRIRQSQTR